jgi:hypothetical protein
MSHTDLVRQPIGSYSDAELRALPDWNTGSRRGLPPRRCDQPRAGSSGWLHYGTVTRWNVTTPSSAG